MHKIILSVCIGFACNLSFSQNENNSIEFNFGFEKTSAQGTLPDNWFQWGMTDEYKLTIDTITKHSGKNAVCIQPSDSKSANSFGCIACKIPAIYEGDEIEVSVYMKLKDIKDGPIGLLLRIDGSQGALEFDNMLGKKIQGTSDWTKYSVRLPLPKNAKTIFIGALSSGTGQLWIDDFELLIDGKDFKKAKQKIQVVYKADNDHEFDKGSNIQSLPLTEKTTENLAVLGKIWGFMKYYHPNVAKGNYNWDYELFRFLPQFLNAETNIERDALLTDWIKNTGTITSKAKTSKTKAEIKLNPDLAWIENSGFSAGLTEALLKIKNAERTDEHYYINLFEEIGNPDFKNENAYKEMKLPDAGFRLLSLYRYWNIIQYYNPNRHLMKEDWQLVLKEFIPKFNDASGELDYKLASLELIAKIHDTHASIWGSDGILQHYRGENYAAPVLGFIENKAVVTGFHDDLLGKETGLQTGDIITAINNVTVEDIIDKNLKYTPASNYPTQLRNIAEQLLRTNDTFIHITFIRNGKTESKQLTTYGRNNINIYSKYSHQDTCLKFVRPDIGYLYLGTIQSAYLPEIMKDIKNTKGLIIDLRCYPSDFVVFTLSAYLLPKTTPFVKFSNGNIQTPGLFTMTQEEKTGNKNKDCYKGKTIILINETTQSQAEYTTMALRVTPGAIVMGSTTAGADGNVSEFCLPGGIYTMISGIGVYYPDGRETQRIGIVPDVELKPTIKGITEGRDELLEKAIELIYNK